VAFFLTGRVQLLLRPGQEYQALLDGLDYVSQVICQLNVIERRYLSGKYTSCIPAAQVHQFVDGLEGAFLKLYTRVLEFQARAVCHLTQHPVTRTFKDMFLVNSWGTILSQIKDAEAICRNFIRVVDSEKLHTGMEENESQLRDLRASASQIQSSLSKQGETQKEEWLRDMWRKFLEALFTSRYEDHKDRNQDRIEGTCEWSTQHPLFKGWEENSQSCLLWISADPGCGKSVLAKYLVDHVVPSKETRTTCYFFFKADSTEQRSIADALCALLRQLFIQRPALRETHKWIAEKFATDGTLLTRSFSALWDILIKVSTMETGEVICVLDALDECAEDDRPKLTQALDKLYRNVNRKGTLKFLITSRPYVHLQREFQILKKVSPTIHLSGEDGVEADKIEKEINIVIQKRVEETGAKLQLEEHEQLFLRNEILLIPNRTYLWVTLIFDVIENSLSYTNKKVQEAIKSVPRTVSEAYERILSQSLDENKARRLLHIVVGAARPLTVKEMRVALAINLDCREYANLDLEPEARFATTVRNLCGLFVTIVDSKIYLLHQTAKEFLVPTLALSAFSPTAGNSITATGTRSADNQDSYSGNEVDSRWKHSLLPVESNRILLEICMSYLLLDIFEQEVKDFYQLSEAQTLRRQDSDSVEKEEYVFLRYAAENWTSHFRLAEIDGQSHLLPFGREICRPQSQRLETWFKTGAKEYIERTPLTELMIASYFGLESIVALILETEKHEIDLEDRDSARTALSMAAENGTEGVVKILLDAGASKLNSQDLSKGRTPLTWAAISGNTGIVKLLLDQKDVESDKPSFGSFTPLSLAAENGHEEIVGLLLEKGAHPEGSPTSRLTPLACAAGNGYTEIVEKLLQTGRVDVSFRDTTDNTPLSRAAMGGHDSVVKVLLRGGKVDPDCRNTSGRSPLSLASQFGHIQVVKLLTETSSVDLDARDRWEERTPLLWAAIDGHEEVVKHLIAAGAKDIECEGRVPHRTALSYASEEGNESVVKLLLETGLANPNSRSTYGRTPLSFASEGGHTGVVKQLLALDSIKPDLADACYGRTPLSWAGAKGHVDVVQLLLDTNAVNLESRDLLYNRTPGSWAAANGHSDVARLLQFTVALESDQISCSTESVWLLWPVPSLEYIEPTPIHSPEASDAEEE